MTSARNAWYAVEAIHDVVYFAPGAADAYASIGITGWWRGYFASRAAALGTPGARVVSALFHGFSLDFVGRAVPVVWERSSPEAILEARLGVARERLASLMDGIEPAPVVAALEELVAGADYAGRTLAAAHADVSPASDAVGRLWQLATALREYRGDCHVAVLTAHGLGGAAANVLAEACGLTDGRQQTVRGWSDEAWRGAHTLLAGRGWLDGEGVITEAGRLARTAIEDETDAVLAAGIDDRALAEVAEPLLTLAARARETGMVPYPNPTATPPAG